MADHIEVTEATVTHGLLTIHLLKEIPEALKPRKIKITSGQEMIEDKKAVA